jgi:hypothetical protein
MTKLKLDAFGVAKSLGQAQKHPNSPKMNKDKMQISGISQQLLCGLSLLLQNTRQLFMAEILTTPANIENYIHKSKAGDEVRTRDQQLGRL